MNISINARRRMGKAIMMMMVMAAVMFVCTRVCSASASAADTDVSKLPNVLTARLVPGSTDTAYTDCNGNVVATTKLNQLLSIEPGRYDFLANEKGTLLKYIGAGGDVVIPAGFAAPSDIGFSRISEYFNGNGITSLTFPDGIEWVTVHDCDDLARLYVPNSATNLVLFGDNMTTVVVPRNVTEFSIQSKSVKELVILGNIAVLHDVPKSESLSSVYIPASVTRIDKDAFQNCAGLKDVYYGGTQAQWDAIVEANRRPDIWYGNTYRKEPSTKFDDSLKGIAVHCDSPEPSTSGLITETATGSILWLNPKATSGNSAQATPPVVPATPATPATPGQVETTPVVPGTPSVPGTTPVTPGTPQVTVIIPDGPATVTTNVSEFKIDHGYMLIKYNGSDKAVAIPANATVIGAGSFTDNASLTNVTIHTGVKTIASYAFSGCSSLKDIYYAGTKAQFGKIKIADNGVGNGLEVLGKATIHCSDGDTTVGANSSDIAASTASPVEPSSTQQPTQAQVSSWAKDAVAKATGAGLTFDGLGNDYTASITRAQFAGVAVKLYEAMDGTRAPDAGDSPFADTNDRAVIQAASLGFVSGVGDGRFDPDALVTREQAATMLARVYTKLGGKIPSVGATDFADNADISDWAMDSVAFMGSKGIITGTGDNRFAPRGNATIEQALAIAVRMMDNLK